MTDMFVGMFALAFVEHNKEFINLPCQKQY